MLKERAGVVQGILRTADLGLIAASFGASSFIPKHSTDIHRALAWLPGKGGRVASASSDQYALLFTLAILGWIAATQVRGTYLSARIKSSRSLVSTQLGTGLIWAAIVACSAFSFKLQLISRYFVFLFLSLSIVVLAGRQLLTQLAAHYVRTKGFNLRDVVVCGNRAKVARFIKFLENQLGSGYRVVQQVIIGPNLPNDCTDMDFDEAFMLSGDAGPGFDDLLLRFVGRGKRVHLVPSIFDASRFRTNLGDLAGVPLLTVGGYGLTLPQRAAKRVLDVVAAAILLLILAPLLAAVALIVKFSPGPVLFSQVRLGEGGRKFRIYKFRTMRPNAEALLRSNPALYETYIRNNYKLPEDQDFRITRIGSILRRTSLDELPQLFNVLRGDMSLVGPRPVVPPEINMYGDYSSLFMSVRPGLTGRWQTNGRADVKDYAQRAALDLEYIRDQSLATDISILLKTIPTVLSRRGAH